MADLSVTQDFIQQWRDEDANYELVQRRLQEESILINSYRLEGDFNQILVVDDEAINIEILSAMIKQLGYQTDHATSGSEAVMKVKERFELMQAGRAQIYKVILLDFSMPDLDGPHVSQEIRQLYYDKPMLSEVGAPYICCCTAYREANFKKKAI